MNALRDFLKLHAAASHSIADQDALTEFYRRHGLIGGGYMLSDLDVLRVYDGIMTDARLTNRARDAYLDALRVLVENHTARGLAHPLIGEILRAQYEFLKEASDEKVSENSGVFVGNASASGDRVLRGGLLRPALEADSDPA